MLNKNTIFLASIFAVLTTTASAATSGSQKFTVIVPTNIAIVPPADVTITHDQTENNQPFPPQPWTVRGNSLAGVTVSFSTTNAFVHTSDPSFVRNAQIGLSVGNTIGPANWTVVQASDTTDFAANDGVATVQASSDGVGRATLNLNVSFVTDGFGSFAAGNYESTVVGTITAN